MSTEERLLKCEINIDDCVGVNCNKGKIVDEVDGYHCFCENGWEGSNCTMSVSIMILVAKHRTKYHI